MRNLQLKASKQYKNEYGTNTTNNGSQESTESSATITTESTRVNFLLTEIPSFDYLKVKNLVLIINYIIKIFMSYLNL